MLEPFLMLTVLNCFFMFSSTVTTCALWWQYRRHCHRCSSHSSEDAKFQVKKSKSCDDESLRDGKKRRVSDFIGYVDDKSKRRGKSSKDAKKSKKEDKKISTGLSRRARSKEAKDTKYLEKLTSTEDMTRRAASPSSVSKSTVVMEVSTVQKVVQIFDNSRDHQLPRQPNETVTYNFLPENQRKVEFVVNSKSGNGTRSMERIVTGDHHD